MIDIRLSPSSEEIPCAVDVHCVALAHFTTDTFTEYDIGVAFYDVMQGRFSFRPHEIPGFSIDESVVLHGASMDALKVAIEQRAIDLLFSHIQDGWTPLGRG